MKLLAKTLAIILITLAGMILLLYVASGVILMGSYATMEHDDMKGEVGSALSALNYDLSMLDKVTVDYAYWDDTYQFIAEPDISEESPYITSNFVDTTFEMQELSVVAYLDDDDRLVFSRSYDLRAGEFVEMPDGFMDKLFPGSPLLRSGSDDSVHGVVMLEGKPMLVSACPIKNSDGNLPTRGTLIMGRFLDDIEVEDLGRVIDKSIDMKPYGSNTLPADYIDARPLLSAGEAIAVKPINDSIVAGYTVIDDVYGNPALILRVDQPRYMYQQGNNTAFYLILSLLAAGLVFSAVTIFLLEKMVLSPIARLSQTVYVIGEKDDPTRRVEVRGDDEVAMLAGTINKTLDTLQRSREKLYANEQKFRSLVENINDIVMELDSKFEFTYISPNVKTILGYEPGEVLGRRIHDLTSSEEIARLKNMSTQLLTAGQPIALINIEVINKEGQIVDMEFSGTRILDSQGNIIGFHGVARDVRERRKVERTLRKWADIFHLARIPITISAHDDLKLDMVNPAFFQLYGYDAGDLNSMRFEEVFDPGYRGDLARHLVLADAEGHHVFESRHVRKDGSSFPAIVDISAVKDALGDLLYRVINVQDITEQKKAEEALREAYEELMISNRALHAEIAERKKVQQQIMASLTEKEILLKEIHHRVKNNLQIISSLLNLQSTSLNKESAAAFRESQNRIKSMALIHEKLYQSRDIAHIDFGEYAGSLTAYLARSYTSNPGVNISIDIRDISLGIDQAIPCGLIINELVSNSLKYAFKDGRSGEIKVNLTIEAGKYVLVVSDDGAGLPEGFDFRDSPSLGLQLVNTLVEQIEGTINMDSERGTKFTITFEKNVRESHFPAPGGE
ncbi:PAS domain S-box protein [Methanocella sp. MCL-LM]|uniref:PAS domain S-box protein n=1 Tax=Methanocella sp. MCL-LM TaxID=3412035 RepID=UPI003C7481EC